MFWLCPCCDVVVMSAVRPVDCVECDCPGEDFESAVDLEALPVLPPAISWDGQ